MLRFRYPAGIFEREKFLRSLYDQLESKDKILVSKRVTSIKHGSNFASVLCADGTEYVGDIIIGADGIHSRIRSEMQRLANESSPGLMDRDKKCKSPNVPLRLRLEEFWYLSSGHLGRIMAVTMVDWYQA